MTDGHWLDDLARGLAAGMSRRQALKRLALAAASGFASASGAGLLATPSKAQVPCFSSLENYTTCPSIIPATADVSILVDSEFVPFMDAICSCSAQTGVTVTVSDSYRSPGSASIDPQGIPLETLNQYAGHGIVAAIQSPDGSRMSGQFSDCLVASGLQASAQTSPGGSFNIDDRLYQADSAHWRERVIACLGANCPPATTAGDGVGTVSPGSSGAPNSQLGGPPATAPWFNTAGCRDVGKIVAESSGGLTPGSNGKQVTCSLVVHICGDRLVKTEQVPSIQPCPDYMKYTSVPARQVCCDIWRAARQTKMPCDPLVDSDCDGVPNDQSEHPFGSP
jgi:hypothetical protein